MGRLLQILGIILMMSAVVGAITPETDAHVIVPLTEAIAKLRSQVAELVPSPAPRPSPLPSATPTPPAFRLTRGGRMVFSLNGSLSLGTHTASQTLDGLAQPSPAGSSTPSPFLGTGAVTTSQSQANGALAFFAGLTRRTATTSTDLRIPLSLSLNSHAFLGNAQVIYSTPKYALGYGPQSGSVLGLLPSGMTERGVYGILPLRNGDATFIEGVGVGAQGETVAVRGARMRSINGNTLYEASLMNGNGPLSGDATSLTLGSATSLSRISIADEISFEQRRGGDAVTSGASYEFRLDDGTTQTYLTAIKRHLANGFLAIGAGEYFGDDYTSLAYHRSGNLQSFALDASTETVGFAAGEPQGTQRQASLAYSGPLGFGQYALQLQSQSAENQGTSSSTQSANSQITAQLGRGSLLLGGQFSRTTTNQPDAGDIALVGYTATYQRGFGPYVAGVSASKLIQYTQLSGNARSLLESLSLGRQFGKTGIQLADTFGSVQSVQSQARTANIQLAVSRAISPVISIQAAYGYQTLSDALNPAANGHSHTFTLQVNAPFSYGNGLVSGRADPKLPATIAGRVMTDPAASPGFSYITSSGVSNVVVILDDKTVQRTDVTGAFQFAFVTPGQHQVRVESASLPRGVTVDIPVNTINVAGGQSAQLTFFVGNFGGVAGHVYGRGSNGEIIPLSNVQLRVDGGTYSQTDQSGSYGFGKLRPGKHTVNIIDSSVPAFASFDKDHEQQTVDVTNGKYSLVDFTADPLGSISGAVVYAPDMGADMAGHGILNAYVVAEPGEHAAIDEDDGSFVIDDLPPGTYTVSVDSESLPAGLGAEPESFTVTLGPRERSQGSAFLVGHSEKKVVFSFVQGSGAASAPKVHLSERRLPLGGAATVTVDAPADAGSVRVQGLGALPLDLTYDAKLQAWSGLLEVPTNTKAGEHQISASVLHGTQPEAATLIVDAKMPVVIMQASPGNTPLGSYVQVRARFLVNVHAGDEIHWQDGQRTVLAKPVVGRIFTFGLRISLRPLHGLLLTKKASVPISLM